MYNLLVTIISVFLPSPRLRLLFRARCFNNRKSLEKKFLSKLGYALDLDNPRTFNEKIQWYKLYYRNPLFSLCADKLRVRKFYAQHGLETYLPQLYGSWKTFAEIDWESLPPKSVLKTNHSSGDNWFILDKSKVDKNRLNREISQALRRDFGEKDAQFFYCSIPRRIIAEELLEDHCNGLKDFKVYCFQGVAEFIQVDFDRFTNHTYAIYDRGWNLTRCHNTSSRMEKPAKLSTMLAIAERLSSHFPHVRVDMYYIQDTIYLGELTFTTGSGFAPFEPEEWDRIFGDYWDLKAIDPSEIRDEPCFKSKIY